MSKLLHFVNTYFGWRNWAVFTYNSAVENVFVIFYIALRNNLSSFSFVLDFFVFICFSMFSTTYGYLVNDYADRDLDRLHGKSNTFENDSRVKGAVIVFLFFVLSAVFGVNFAARRHFMPLWVCWAFLATFYSLKPIRLKERGKLGLILVVVAQRVLPGLVMFAAFGHYDWIDISVVTAYVFFRGLSSDLNHQIEDFQGDAVTSTDTYAVRAGIERTRGIFRFSLEMEKILLAACLLLMLTRLQQYHYAGISLLLPLVACYILLYLVAWRRTKQSEARIDKLNPFAKSDRGIFHFIHHTFPSVLLPVYLLLLLLSSDVIFTIPLIFLVFYRKLYSIELMKRAVSGLLIR